MTPDDRPAGLSLEDPTTAVPGIGPTYAGRLASTFGIQTVRDLLAHYPRRYQDLGAVVDLATARVGEPATLVGTVRSWTQKQPRPKLRITEATVEARGGGRFLATFFNQPWRARQLGEGTVAAFSGELSRFKGTLQLTMPELQVLGSRDVSRLDHHPLQPLYPATEDLPSWRLADWIETVLEALPPLTEHLPAGVVEETGLAGLDAAVRGIHRPPDRETRQAARRRLAFDELFFLQLGLHWRRTRLEDEVVGLDNGPVDGAWSARFMEALPFEPTGAQRRAIAELSGDLGGDRPMHRLLQGDVGAGKTLVAVWAMLCAVDQGRQAALMVPTEVLAEQHHRTLEDLLAPLGVNVLDGLRVELLTSSVTAGTRRRVLGELLSGRTDLVVGTHALLEEGVRFDDLGVVVIDEQHRFGVAQRVQLREKAGGPTDGAERGGTSRGAGDGGLATDRMPDVLVMTATPIPRSLALTFYGDLEVTVLDELPPGRRRPVTELITPAEAHRRDRLYGFVRREAQAGRGTFVVCPLVEESEELAARAATTEHGRLSEQVWPDLAVGLVHGRLSSDDKQAAMEAFRRGETDVLVSTTVIEVGVDVPTASVMIIEDAERFGISQLHQLRGRVGRGDHDSYCVLFAGWRGELTDAARARLEAVAAVADGFELAERDLELRGHGQLFGERQSGLPDLELARLTQDRDLIEDGRRAARRLLEEDPGLTRPTHRRAREELFRRYEGGLEEFAALETG